MYNLGMMLTNGDGVDKVFATLFDHLLYTKDITCVNNDAQ
jgi:TPR repeat protein